MSSPKSFRSLALRAALLLALASAAPAQTPERRSEWEPRGDRQAEARASVLFRFRDDVDAARRSATLERFDLAHAEILPGIDVWRADAPAAPSLSELCRALEHDGAVAFAEPDRLLSPDHVPTDPAYSDNYGHPGDLQRWVFNGLAGDRNLDAEAAWDLTRGDPSVVVAIVDSGVAWDHPELAPNLWTNPGEIPDNGIDDDGNGYVDDVHGWDFVHRRADARPDLGNGIDDDGVGGADSNVSHGTMVASIAVARQDDGIGMTGGAPLCRFLPLTVLADDGGARTSSVAAALVYAANAGAKVINVSLAGAGSTTLSSAVSYAHAHGSLVVGAAGNDDSATPLYPASYSTVVSVGACDSGSIVARGSGDIDGRAAFSQFGPAAVRVVAPGVFLDAIQIRSTADGNPGALTYRLVSGTSFAAPLVSAAAALVWSRALALGVTLGPDDVASILETTAIDLPDDPGDSPDGGASWDGHGRVSYRRAVARVAGLVPTAPPVADAGPDAAGTVDFPIAFDASASSSSVGAPLRYAWDFGDGKTSDAGPRVGHVFAASGHYVVRVTVSDGESSASDTCEAVVADRPQGPILYLSFAGSTYVAGLGRVADEDIVLYDPQRGAWATYFHGADVGLAGCDVDAFTLLPDGSLLLSFDNPVIVSGLAGGPDGERVEDSDLVRFIPSSLGSPTAGRFVFYFDASDVGLVGPAADVDAVTLAPEGDLVFSIAGSAVLEGVGPVTSRDLVRFVPETLGATTRGRWEPYLRGAAIGLVSSSDDIDAVHVSPTGDVFFSTKGRLSVPGLEAADEDVSVFVPTQLGVDAAGAFHPYFVGARAGIPAGADVDGIYVKE
jgi:subtilisin family serine protease